MHDLPAEEGARDDMCSATGRFEGWSLAPYTSLGTGGKSIVLSGFSSFPPAAVRYAWRAYPCEAHGCGVYAMIEDVRVPPAPFYSKVGSPLVPMEVEGLDLESSRR